MLLISKWLDFITPASRIQATSLVERERRRKLGLLNIILACSFLLNLPILILGFFPSNMETLITGLFEIMVLVAFWITRSGHLRTATYLYLFSFLAVNALSFINISPGNSTSLLWLWLPILLPAILAGLLLPFWSPFLFACIEGVSITGMYLLKHHADTTMLALPSNLVPDFLTYTNVLIFATALIGAVYSFNLDKAVQQADRATELEEAYAKLKELAVTDPITGLLNHRALTESLLETFKLAQNNGQQLGVIFADIDHFKRINDTWGHQIGDAVLAHVASLLRLYALEARCIGRYGGEEFVLVYLHEDAPQIEHIVEEIRAIIAQSPLYLPEGQAIHVTISMGVAHFPLHGTKCEELLHAADEAMYHAKHTGRNRICIAAPNTFEELVLMHG